MGVQELCGRTHSIQHKDRIKHTLSNSGVSVPSCCTVLHLGLNSLLLLGTHSLGWCLYLAHICLLSLSAGPILYEGGLETLIDGGSLGVKKLTF